MSARNSARHNLRRGSASILIPAWAKAPVLPGWLQLVVIDPDVEQVFQPSSNVGLAFCESSNRQTGVDHDKPEAMEIAELCLPPAGVVE
jgi:hypothetical protein